MAELIANFASSPKKDSTPYHVSKNFEKLEKLKDRREFKVWAWRLEQCAKQAFGQDAEEVLHWAQDRNEEVILKSDVEVLAVDSNTATRINEQLHSILMDKPLLSWAL